MNDVARLVGAALLGLVGGAVLVAAAASLAANETSAQDTYESASPTPCETFAQAASIVGTTETSGQPLALEILADEPSVSSMRVRQLRALYDNCYKFAKGSAP